jgi:putative membrane protein
MNCYNHTDTPVVGTCIDCGRGLCRECATKYTLPICSSCNLLRIRKEKETIIKEWVISFIIGIILAYLMYNHYSEMNKEQGVQAALMTFYMAMSARYGWKALNAITPDIFLQLPMIGWFVFYFIKTVLSLIIGVFIAPIKIFLEIKRFIEINKIDV